MPLPNEAETQLLRAALLEREPALKAFAVWRNRLDFEALSLGSQRVLALLHQNLRAHGIEDPLMNRLRGIARYAWFSNRTLISATQPLLAEFDRAGVQLAFLKGMALVASVPGQLALRPMTDVDVLVRPTQAAAAIDILIKMGWRAFYGTSDFIKQEVLERSESYGFEKGPHLYLDLHWNMLKLSRWPGADDALWSRTAAGQIGEVPCSTPCLEDQLLNACVHGAPWDPDGSLRWAADCVIILRETGVGFNWDYLVDQARDRRVVAPVRYCVKYLHEKLDVPVPAAIRSRLGAERVRIVERIDYKFRGCNPSDLSPSASSFLEFQNWRHASRQLTWGATPPAFLAWLRNRWAVDSSYFAVAMTILKKIGRPAWLRQLIHRAGLEEATKAALKRRPLPQISDGLLDFSLSGNPKGALLYGWSDPESSGRWTDGGEAAIALDLGDASPSELEISATVAGILGRSGSEAHAEVWANGIRLPDWRFNKADELLHLRVLQIPSFSPTRQTLVLTFVIRDPCSPKALGISADVRQLGIFFQRMNFSTNSRTLASASLSRETS